MTTFTLEPQENDRLQSLCGAFDENIKLIEKEFNLNISRNNFTFTVKSNDESPKPHHEQLIERAAKLIQALYAETAPIKGKVKELDLEDVHIALQESRMLSQAGSACCLFHFKTVKQVDGLHDHFHFMVPILTSAHNIKPKIYFCKCFY